MQSTNNIVLIDYGIGNLRSVHKALEVVGAEVIRSSDPEVVLKSRKLVLPGVGAFGACADALRRADLEEPVLEAVSRGSALLGVCVGMQLLFDRSTEKGSHRGLGLLPGTVERFPDTLSNGRDNRLKVPHVGWNRLAPSSKHEMLGDLPSDAYVYFVHSYIARPQHSDDVLAITNYGVSFPSVVGRNRVFGVQFHPEKSQKAGLQILRNFVERIE